MDPISKHTHTDVNPQTKLQMVALSKECDFRGLFLCVCVCVCVSIPLRSFVYMYVLIASSLNRAPEFPGLLRHLRGVECG